jgi:uncharacterized protein YoxC
MVPYYGDFAEDDTVNLPFNTFTSDDPAISATITNLADADIKVHKDGAATPIIIDGATVVINLNSATGNHMITIDTSADAAYATGSEYSVRVEGVTVDGGADIDMWIGSFSIERAGGVLALMKATTLASIKAETALIVADTNELQGDDVPGLIATLDAVVDTVKAETALIVADTNELQTDDVPGLISTLDAVVDTVKAETALIVADTNELQADDIPATLATIAGYLDTEIAAIKAETALIVADTNELQQDDVPGLIATLDAVVDTVKTETALIVADTNELQADDVPGLIATLDAVVDTVKAETALIVADTNELQQDDIPAKITALLTTQMTEAYAADGTAPTLAQALFLIQQTLTEFAIASTTVTIKKLDGSTTAATLTLDSDSAPTSATRAT